jgi:hypothetical protein
VPWQLPLPLHGGRQLSARVTLSQALANVNLLSNWNRSHSHSSPVSEGFGGSPWLCTSLVSPVAFLLLLLLLLLLHGPGRNLEHPFGEPNAAHGVNVVCHCWLVQRGLSIKTTHQAAGL